MSSKISVYIALFLFFFSWCVPAVEGAIGIGVMFMAFFSHIFILPFFTAFPVWANITFLIACRDYYKSFKEPNYRIKALGYAVITTNLMICGVCGATASHKLNTGALIWLASSIFLLSGICMRAIPEKYARLILLILIMIFCYTSFKVYKYTIDERQYLSTKKLRYAENDGLLFLGKDLDQKMPVLNKVIQNNAKRERNKDNTFIQIFKFNFQNNQKPDTAKVFDLSSLSDGKVQIDFNFIDPQQEENRKEKCLLNNQKTYTLLYPNTYLKDGFDWKIYFNSGEIAIGHTSSLVGDYLYRASNLDSRHTKIQIIQTSTQKILYEQELLVNYQGYDGCIYEPSRYQRELGAAFYQAYSPKENKFGNFKSNIDLEYPEKLSTTCEWKPVFYNVYEFENKRIDFLNNILIKPQIFCSKHYVAVAYLRKSFGHIDDSIYIKMFQRHDLKPVECGTVSSLLSESQIQGLYSGKIAVKELNILDPDRTKACRSVEIKLSDGFVTKDSNDLAK